jgi:hypothetical protein
MMVIDEADTQSYHFQTKVTHLPSMLAIKQSAEAVIILCLIGSSII